ncbi:MAG TPA: alpha/beta fold hydrolase, partial [Gemmatimonadaceae bacterium]
PTTDCDGSPTWSADSKHIAFLRRPGIPFGRQENEGGGGGGAGGNIPLGPPQARAGGAPQTCGFGGGFGGGGGGGGRGGRGGEVSARDTMKIVQSPGFMDQTFPGGHRLIIMIADATKCTELSYGCDAKELWHPQASDRLSQSISNIQWTGDHLLFTLAPPNDDWDRWYSLSVTAPQPQPVLLTTTNGLIEGATSVATSKDGKTFYYCTNAEDIESRHIWSVPTGGGTPVQVSKGAIEMNPVPMANGKDIAVLYYDYNQPASVAIVPASGGSGKVIFPTLPKDFPKAAHVKPEVIWLTAADSMKFSNQLFKPKDLKPGERRPALVFVHGGPARQMLPAYHYMQFYHWFYAFNQYLANQGYIVISVNYRSGIGYGRSFQRAANTNARGNSEYQDVLAAGKYLQTRDDVDPTRIGIWGLSYGGLLTAEALARNSDLFIAGADYAGVHMYGNSLDPDNLGFKSSAVGAIDGWKSPVFLVQGDDDRNVSFSQMVGLVSLLRARGVYYELMVNPDDQHESF